MQMLVNIRVPTITFLVFFGFLGALRSTPDGRVLAAPAPQLKYECDRDCLKNTIDAYLAALLRHDDNALPLAKDVKFTENAATLQLGDGLWVGASEGPTFKIYGLDPVAGQAGIFCLMKEFNKPAIVSIRLKVEGGIAGKCGP
jgi:hypothetical protein